MSNLLSLQLCHRTMAGFDPTWWARTALLEAVVLIELFDSIIKTNKQKIAIVLIFGGCPCFCVCLSIKYYPKTQTLGSGNWYWFLEICTFHTVQQKFRHNWRRCLYVLLYGTNPAHLKHSEDTIVILWLCESRLWTACKYSVDVSPCRCRTRCNTFCVPGTCVSRYRRVSIFKFRMRPLSRTFQYVFSECDMLNLLFIRKNSNTCGYLHQMCTVCVAILMRCVLRVCHDVYYILMIAMRR